MRLKGDIDKAFRILCRNYSCPGPDKISFKDIKEDYPSFKREIISKIEKIEDCRPSFSTTEIIDFKKKKRNIEIYNITDRWVQVVVKLFLRDIIYPKNYYVCWGTRPGFPELGYIEKILEMNKKYVLYTDIIDFYLNINHDILIKNLSKISSEKSIINFIKNNISHKEKGLPIGNALSPLLADLYLMEIDSKFKNNYLRRSDDMFFVLDKRSEADIILLKLENYLKEIGMELNKKKTKLTYKPKREDLI